MRPEPPAAASQAVLGAVVTYNPAADLQSHLRSLRSQIAEVVVIDNGSANLGAVRAAAEAEGCRLIANGANLGIAVALNQAVDVAARGGFAWLATFDQDSDLEPGALMGLLNLYLTHPDRDRIGVLATSHTDRATGRDYHQPGDILVQGPDARRVKSTITAGSVTPMATFARVGGFDDALFIDSVDHDFCLRCRKAGLLIVESTRHHIRHSLGDLREITVLGARLPLSNHSADRRYYITRNTLEISRRYFAVDPAWVLQGLKHLLFISLTAVAFEGERLAKLSGVLAGGTDFVLRRFGPRPRGPEDR